MFYISSRRDDTFGVKDTKDSVEEFYSPSEIERIVKDSKVRILGTYFNRDDKFYIGVRNFTQFNSVDWCNMKVYRAHDDTNKKEYIYVEDENGDVRCLKVFNSYDYYGFMQPTDESERWGRFGIIDTCGKENKFIGVYLWVSYTDGDADVNYSTVEVYFERLKDGTFNIIRDDGCWGFDEDSPEMKYMPDCDSVKFRV